jgi:hypothetical protein
VMLAGVGALFAKPVASYYWLALGLFSLAAILFARRRTFEIYLLSAVALALNVLLVAGLVRLLSSAGGNGTGTLLVVGLVAAGLLAATVGIITGIARAPGSEQ